ncbi:MAG: hypothetical protein ACREKF_09025 [Candidatus Methylomirabilales bacterium]
MRTLPLAAASQLLRRKPGRPRKVESGHVPGTSPAEERGNSGPERGALAIAAIVPRLLDLRATARYLGVSPWTVRDLEAAGVLWRVGVPLRGRDLRKLLFDRADLDRLIDGWKENP